MSIGKSNNPLLIFNLAISLVGLFIVGLLSIYSSAAQTILWQKQLMSIIFASLCGLGAIAVVVPNMCSGMAFGGERFRDVKNHLSEDKHSSVMGITLIHGHHPSLNEYSRHEFRIKTKTFCAGCFGLLIGALASIIGITVYNLVNIETVNLAQTLVGSGIVVVALSLFSPLFYSGKSVLRILLNAILVLGMLSILVGIDTLRGSLEINLFLIGLFIFWIMTRIIVSRFNHDRILASMP